MSTPSGDLHVVDFKTNQIVSAIQPKDYWDDKRHWEIKNNIDILEFRVFENTDHAATLVQQNLVLKEVRGGRIVPYVITETEKDSKDRSLMVYASGEWIQLAKAGIIEPQKIESKTLKQCMEIALKGTKWKIGKTEHDGAHSMVIEEFTDPLDLLKKIAASFELEIQYRAEVVGSKIVGRYVDMVQKRGRDTRKEITFGKDLIGIKRIENSQSICTALLGFVKKENGEFITISSINKGVPYLVDDAAYQRWNENGKHKFAFYTPQTDDQNMSPERLLTLMKTEMSKLVNASVSYGVDAQNIARIPGLSHEEINEGDKIRIIDEGFTPKLYIEARAIAGDESFKDPTQDNYVFGDYREIVDQNDELRRLYQKILSSLYDKVPQELFDQLNNKVKEQNKDIIDAKDKADQAQKESQTAKDLAEATQKYMNQNLVDIIEGANPPTTNLKPNKTLWRDISNGKPGILKIWTGTVWEPVVPDTAPLQQSIKEVKEDIETAKTELNQKVQSVEGKAQEIAGQIVDVQKQVNGKVDQTWIHTQLKDKADKSGVFTKEEINNGFIGKQIYETDKNGNVKKFQDINTSMSQTNEALKQKAEKSELTKTNEGLSQLEQKTNEIKTTAEGTKQTLTELKTQVDNTKLDGRNSLKNSNFSSYIVNDSISWDKSLNGNLQASGWGSGYNGGVADPTKGYHAHLDITTFGYPVVAFINKNSIIGQKNRWLGIAEDVVAEFARNNVADKEITISMDIWSDTKGFRINGGLHHFIEGNTAQSFHSGQYVLNVSEVNRWERYTFTMKLHEKFDVTKAVRLYIYGGEGIEGTAYVKNVKLELSNVATAWTPAPEDQVTTTDFTKKTVEIETTIKGINTTVSNVQNEQGKLTERMTKSEQTADGFKTSIESLTKKDTEISNKLNTVESTVEGTKQTISDVQQTTSELKKTTTEIKEEAGKVTEKLSSVEKKFDDMKIGGRNILLSTGGTLKSDTGTTVSNIVNKLFKIVPDGLSMLQGQQFTISFKARTIGYEKGTPNPWAGVEVWIKYKDGEQLWPGVRCESDVNANQEWKTYSFTYNLKDKAIEVFNPQTLLRNVKGMIELKEWQIEIGNKATDYKPAAEDQVTTDEFTKKTTEIEKSVDGVKTTVSKVQNSQDGFEKRMTTVEQTATGLSSTVSNLNNVVSDQGKKLTDANTKLEQQATAIGAKVELKQVENYVAGFKIPELKQTVDKNKQDLLGELANKLATEQFNQKMTLIDNRFIINEQGINASAKKTEVYTKDQANGQFATSSYVRDMETRLQLTEKGVRISVKENDVIAAFNMSKENITLNANRINLRGFITADHIKGQVLEGVTLKTSGSRFVEINKQDMKIFDADRPRGYIGFMEANDGSIQPSLVLGSDNRKYAGTGSFYIYQVMPRINGVDQPSKAYAKFGISKGENAEGTNIWSSYIQMQNDGGHLYAYAAGRLYFDNLNDIVFNSVGWAPGYGKFIVTTTEPHYFKNDYGEFHFGRKSTGNSIYFANGVNDHDLNMGRLMLRASLVSGYDMNLQIKDVYGNGWRDIELRTLRANENVNANGQMWAKAFNPTSARNMKENIKDIPFSALDKIMSLAIKQYNFKDDMYDLYQMRVNKPEEKTESYTTKEIETYFGMIADDTEDIFTDKEKRAINLYNTVSIFIVAFQQQYHEFNEEVTTVKGENKQLKEQVTTLANDVATLTDLVQKLINGKPEQP
ncbi:phage tail spike protein [Bacillus cereus]|uniref:Tail fiber domain-containing protein n=2 Tax=Bacillus cereus TaxID=1396 RepID=A0AAW5KVU0_BACCE|nr:phage tail spike protein [Bacillus cereus]MCQ6286141.1 tail fiber domain-containing protein [Bacillus cereus]MCQ6306619.1 tail fiber domain-containing protein [Bacillus cereus]MCQ6315030.1 tail fiber domain-containing protein [Bacillus cereus]MCQ6326897.1 tail fiber domain-containing protein [Bacillus cereus]MCQ6383378.1 tail fiber domain-containing protein [Bacillus cereus]